jgi:hypothetical protein
MGRSNKKRMRLQGLRIVMVANSISVNRCVGRVVYNWMFIDIIWRSMQVLYVGWSYAWGWRWQPNLGQPNQLQFRKRR